MISQLHKINEFIGSLDDNLVHELSLVSKSKHFRKGDYLLREGEVCRESFWVEDGVVRKFYMHNGKEITTEFCFKDDLAVCFDSYILQKPGREYIQALTSAKISITEFSSFNYLKMKYREIQELDLLMTEYYALSLEEKVFELHTQNATQRYRSLLQKSPHIIQQVALTQIASYLNVSLETLSRIRARV